MCVRARSPVLWVALALAVAAVPAAAVVTANSLRPDLLPADCGGRPDAGGDGAFPWQARLVAASADAAATAHLCSGLLISRRHVLTAAGCTRGTPLSRLRVRVGGARADGTDAGEQEFGVVNLHVPGDSGSDVALLELRTEYGVRLGPRVRPACLPAADAAHEPFLPCWVTGWGSGATLRGDRQPLASDIYCQAPEVHGARYIPDRSLCTAPAGGSGGVWDGVCSGEAGSPLVCPDRRAGTAVAYGLLMSVERRGCGHRPGLYARLAGYVPWMLRLLQMEATERAAADWPPAAAAGGGQFRSDAGGACVVAAGGAGRCRRLANCVALRQLLPDRRAELLRLPLCGLAADLTPLLCCPDRPPSLQPSLQPSLPPSLQPSLPPSLQPSLPPSLSSLRPLPSPPSSPPPSMLCGRAGFSPPLVLGAARAGGAADWPWMAAVMKAPAGSGRRRRPVCAGAVVSRRWIVTGATCAPDHVPLAVRLGDATPQNVTDDSAANPPLDMRVVEVVRHPKFGERGNVGHDIALLKTAADIPFSSSVSAICLPDARQPSAVPTDKSLIMAGWGAPQPDDRASPAALKWARLRVVDSNSCRVRYSQVEAANRFFANDSFCTRFEEPTEKFKCAVNQGDQAAVFMDVSRHDSNEKWFAVGLAVGGIGCGGDYPDINIALGPSVDWISSVISADD